MDNINDGYDIDSFEGGFIPNEVEAELNAIERAVKQARKEERVTCKDRHADYKLKLKI